MTATASQVAVSAQQYSALQNPVVLPTPEELFDFQVETLRDKGFDLSGQDVDRLQTLIPSRPQLFLVVPPRPDTLDLEGLMSLVEINGVQGKNYLDPQRLTDVINASKSAHLLVDVEDGRKRLNTRPCVSFKKILREGRIPYTIWHGLIHAITFSYVLQDHYLDLVNSRAGYGRVPDIYLNESGVSGLRDRCDEHEFREWGAPSAGSVLEV